MGPATGDAAAQHFASALAGALGPNTCPAIGKAAWQHIDF